VLPLGDQLTADPLTARVLTLDLSAVLRLGLCTSVVVMPKKAKKYKVPGSHGKHMLEAVKKSKPKEDKKEHVPQNKYMMYSHTTVAQQGHHLHGGK